MIERRIAAYGDKEIKFNLMALVQDRRITLQKALENLPDGDVGAVERAEIEARLVEENEKRRRWTRENELRR